MPRYKLLKALPSMVIMPNGDTVPLDSLSPEEKKKVCDKMCENISKRMSDYYTAHPDNWQQFLSVMTET